MKKTIIIILIIAVALSVVKYVINMDTTEAKLIRDWCIRIQPDVDWNSCSLNESRTAFDAWCTEMLTTKMLEVPICVEYNK